MNWTKTSAVAEIVSSIAIVITLMYLVVETRQNSAAIEANSRQVSIGNDLEILGHSVTNPEIQLLRFDDEPTDEEASRLEGWLIMLVRSREHQWFQYDAGLLDERTWNSYLSGLRGNLSSPSTRRWWEEVGHTFFDQEFADAVNEYLLTVPILEEYSNRFRADWSP